MVDTSELGGGGSTGPLPHPVTSDMPAATKHSAVVWRRKESKMETVAASGLREVPVVQSTPARNALAALFVSAVLLALAFPPFNMGIVSFIALVPLFLFWSKASWKHAFWWGWLAGSVAFLFLFYWMTHSVGDFIGSWSLLALVFICVIEGFFVALVGLLGALVGRGQYSALCVFALPAAWLLAETLRTRGAFGVPFGELGLVAAHLSWMLPLAAYGSVYFITAIIALINAAIAGIIAGTPAARRVGTITLVAVALIIVLANIDRHREAIPHPTLRVGIAQGNISQREKWTPSIFEKTIAIYSDLTRQAAARGARVVIWPETVITSYPLQEPLLLHQLESLSKSTNVWLLAGTIDRPDADTYYNAMLDLTPQGSVAGVYHKDLLLPFAEYLPLDNLLRRLPLMNAASRFRSGPGPHLLDAAGFAWGTLICWESAFEPYARRTANAGADAIVVATDDAWFGTTGGPYQHEDIAVLDAVSTGRWVVRGADTGVSTIIDPQGNSVARLGLDRMGVIVANIGRGVATPYDRFGVVWLLVAALAVLIWSLVPRREQTPGWRSKRGTF